jgi:N-acetyl-gamma-glutamyl-phosphate reductase
LNNYSFGMNKSSISAAVVGATGYTGQELMRLLASHPCMRVAYVTSQSQAGESVRGNGLRYVRAEDVAFGEVDVVFTCLPTGASGEWALRAREAGARVIDLSADLREGVGGAVYGLTELWREAVRGAALVANPGCYPTGILLALVPLARRGLLDRSRAVMVDAASGVTGAGRDARRDLLFGEVAEDYRAYGVGNTHRHVPEIRAGLARGGGAPVPFVFTPHLLPVRRGILETMYVPVAAGVTAAEVLEAWRAAYAGEAFVRVVPDTLPSLREVVHGNGVALGAAEVRDVEAPLVLAVAAFDNLLKGAAGQALQNANLMFGLEETDGLWAA